MKPTLLLLLLLIGGFPAVASSELNDIPQSAIHDAFADHEGVFYIVNCSSGRVFDSDPAASSKRHAPCSTFKIWNALLGTELGLIDDPDEPLHRWDGVESSVSAWNRDLSLREAFQASCVPTFQDLARRIGGERMQQRLQQIGYGDGDASAGVDVFWLPESGRKSILISPEEQVGLLRNLLGGELPVSPDSVATLRRLMEVRRTETAVLFGKTRTPGTFDMGWFVGFLEPGGEAYAFACLLKGEETSGLDARAARETILASLELL